MEVKGTEGIADFSNFKVRVYIYFHIRGARRRYGGGGRIRGRRSP